MQVACRHDKHTGHTACMVACVTGSCAIIESTPSLLDVHAAGHDPDVHQRCAEVKVTVW